MARNVTLTRVAAGQDASAKLAVESVLGDGVSRLNMLGKVGGDAGAVRAQGALVQRLARLVHHPAHVRPHEIPHL